MSETASTMSDESYDDDCWSDYEGESEKDIRLRKLMEKIELINEKHLSRIESSVEYYLKEEKIDPQKKQMQKITDYVKDPIQLKSILEFARFVTRENKSLQELINFEGSK